MIDLFGKKLLTRLYVDRILHKEMEFEDIPVPYRKTVYVILQKENHERI